MAHRQKNRDGLPTRHRLTAANDPDTAHREVLRRLETYGKDPDASLHEVAKDTVLLLRALNHRLHHFQAQILADIKLRESYNEIPRPQPQNDIYPGTRDHRCTLTSPAPPTRVSRSECVHTTDADERDSSPVWRSTKAEEVQPQANLSAPDTTTSDKPRLLDINRGNPCPASQIYQETQLISETNGPINTNPVDSSPQIGVTATNRHQPQTLKHVASIDDNGNEDTSVTPGHANFEQNPSIPQSQHAAIRESKKTRVPPNSKYMTTIRDTPVYYEHSLAAAQTKSPPGKDYGARPPRQPGGRDTSDPETKLNTKHNSRQRCTAVGPHTVANQEESHTD